MKNDRDSAIIVFPNQEDCHMTKVTQSEEEPLLLSEESMGWCEIVPLIYLCMIEN